MSGATSVIIPCYNGEPYLPEALESIRLQTAPAREILVVDDGSHVPLQPPPAWNGPPLHIIRTPNQGLAAARNVGLTHATGEFIAFLDSDDFWHPRKIEAQEQALRSDPRAVACYTRCVEAPGFFGFGPYPPADVSEDEFLLVLWYNSFFPPSAVMLRHNVLAAVGVFREDFGNGEDIELWLRLLTRGHFAQVAEPLCYYRRHANQFTMNVYRRVAGGKAARGAMIAQHADRLVQAGLRRDRLWDAYRNDILLVYYRRQFGAARRLLWDYWKDHPGDYRILFRALVSLLPAKWVTAVRGQLPESAPAAVNAQADSTWRKAFGRLLPVRRPSEDALDKERRGGRSPLGTPASGGACVAKPSSRDLLRKAEIPVDHCSPQEAAQHD
jgi:glycosyltransferase involved in cell wall biosynthesis